MNVFEVIAVGVLALTGLASLALVLRFLWLVYDRGGRADLIAAARAFRQVHDPNWVVSPSKFLPVPPKPDGEAR
jgi:hypothetical protein